MTYFLRKNKCPRHFVIKPGKTGFVMELDKKLNGFSDETLKRFNLNRWKKKRDKSGRPIRNDNDYYQPEMSSAFFIEHVYDPKNWICKHQCKNRCWEGHGMPSVIGIKRLNGKSHTGKDLPTPVGV